MKSRDESVKSNVMESENKHAQPDVDIDVHRMSSVDVEELFNLEKDQAIII